MGIGAWFQKTFGKQPCAFCGTEVGMMKRTKIKNKEFICNTCRSGCSRYMDVYRYTKDELLEHMAYMNRQEKLYNSLDGATVIIPSSGSRQAIEFYDQIGMFRIRDLDLDERYPKELIRYDQVMGYEAFCLENEPEEEGKPKTFEECGVKISLADAVVDPDMERKGLRPHPYIIRDLEVVVNKHDKRVGMLDVDHIIYKFNQIFGVNDDRKGMFDFGLTTQQKREAEAMKSVGNMFVAAVQTAKEGGTCSAETVQQAHDAIQKVENAVTSGLAQYTRLADEAESNIQ